ncbi:Type I Iterative PKS [Gnomoniopsis sp. IMI 355080]|nr:Type I Iterative PKS [Gnomoniopsis sp. IMI 355080]
MAINSVGTETYQPAAEAAASKSYGDTQSTENLVEHSEGAPIAIVGMSCRFAGEVTSPSKLWDLCTSGGDAWTPIPHERFDVSGLYDKRKSTRGRAMDPQIRLLLESVYESTEDGSFSTDYSDMTLKDSYTMHDSYKTGNGIAMLSNRISHFYNFQGASMTLDVGCSTGLVAVHQAIQTLRCGESDVAIVGSSLLCLSPDMFIAMANSSVLGPTGKCFAWDDRAEGYGRGEGVASLVLKPLAAAIRDGDRVHAVVRESGLNQDGKTPTITSPSVDAQASLIRDVYRRARLEPSTDTGYVEAHMTGTPTGDPIEAEALARTFGKGRAEDDPVLVGSVKPNIGHTEPVSGLAAVIKTIFALREGVIPPNANYENTNPNIPLKDWRLKVPRISTPWPADKPRRASINNFGYGGTNAHLILEAPPKSHRSPHRQTNGEGGIVDGSKSHGEETNGSNGNESGHHEQDRSMIYIVSAKDSAGASKMNNNLATYLSSHNPLPRPIDLAFTLAERKSRFPWITAVRASTLDELAEKMASTDRKPRRSIKAPRLGFVFNGQGAQWHAMGRELIAGYPVFRRSLLSADHILREYGATWSLQEELLRDKDTTRVNEIRLSQPLSVALQLCLVDLLSSWGITPTAVTSHSSGEIAAAYAVGALTFRQALGVVYFRGELAQKHKSGTQGAMLAAGVSADAAAPYIERTENGKAVVACHNSPQSVTISGDEAAVDEVADRLKVDGIFARKLNVPLAYHSHHMQAMATDYTDALHKVIETVPCQWTGAIFSSPVTGGFLSSPEALTPEHFVRNLVSPVLFAQAFEEMCFGVPGEHTGKNNQLNDGDARTNVDIIVEIGAHGTLAGPIRQIYKDRKQLPYVSLLKRNENALYTMQDAASMLLAYGYPLALASVNDHASGTLVPGLPGYAWNHSTAHWTESRLSREHRHKRFQPHELLGSTVAGSNPLKPMWRGFLRTEDIPWLADHKLGGDVVLPGAGYIAMAIEGVRMLTDKTEQTIEGYRLRDIEFLNAMTIPDTALGVEVQTMLSPCSDLELEYKGWYDFEVWSTGVANDSWIQHCKGAVTAETVTKTKEADTKFIPQAPLADSFLSTDASVRKIPPEAVFAGLRSMNLFHGPAFQNLLGSQADATKSLTKFVISPAAVPAGNTIDEQTYALHPTTLDSLIQAAFVSIPDATRQNAMAVPRSIRQLYVPRNLHRKAGEEITVFVDLERANRRGARVNAVAVNGKGDDVSASQLELDGLYCQAVPLELDDSSDSQNQQICSHIRWEIDLANGWVSEPFKAHLQRQAPYDDEARDFERKLDRISYRFIFDAVQQLASDKNSNVSDEKPPHLRRFHRWMETVVARGRTGELGPGSRMWSRSNAGVIQKLIDDVAAESPVGELLGRIGPLLANIVRGITETEVILKQDDLLDRYYETLPRFNKRSLVHLEKLLARYAVLQPGSHVLEIGGRSGGTTTHVLNAFAAKNEQGESGTLLGQYHFTDVVADHFELVKEKCAPWEELMTFSTLNLLQDPVAQDFVEGRYDLIVVGPGALLGGTTIASAAGELEQALTNIRRLLKPGGKLALVETTRDRLDTHLLFGGLPHWSSIDDTGAPEVFLERWNSAFRAAGLEKTEIEISDCDDEQFQTCSVMFATAHTKSSHNYPTAISIVHTNDATPTQEWLDQLKLLIGKETGATVRVECLSEVEADPQVVYIFTPEVMEPFLDSMDEAGFNKLKALIVQGQGMLWLSRSSVVDSAQPIYAQSHGLLRAAKQEDTTKRYVSLDFEATANAGGPGTPWLHDMIRHIVYVVKQSFDATISLNDIEWEYALKHGMLHVPRAYPSLAEDRASSETPVDPTPVEQPLWQTDRPLVWETIQTSGTLSNLYFTDDPKATEPVLPPNYVEIKTQALGLNFRDVLVALGQIDDSLYMHDAAGIVTRMGPNTEASGLKIGDRVTGTLEGRFATHPRALWTGFAKMPDDMTWEEGASIPCIFLTSYLCLFDVARLQPGERVLIHAGGGGVGQSAIMLAQHAGAEVFTTCSSQAKRALLMEHYGLDADHILSSRDPSFATAIRARTGGAGVDVVINSLSGPLLKATWDCMARFGRFVEIGKVDMEAARRLDLTPLMRNAMMVGFDLIQWCMYQGSAVHQAMKTLMDLWSRKVIHAVHPIIAYPIADMETAMRRMQRGAHVGKLVLVPEPDARFKVLTRTSSLARLDVPDATYMIAGGLGGIGLALAEWMMTRGARHILVVSRRAESHPQAEPLRARGQARGCNVVVRNCDIAHRESLMALLTELASSMPPIRGVIQAAMALHDTILPKLTYEQWQSSLQPKVTGTLNLHHCSPTAGLDFFVMLSSVSGVLGLVSQANYGAGNSFQDALARHRATKGLPAVAIDLPAVSNVGVVTKSGDTTMRSRLEQAVGSPSVSIDRVLRLVEAAVVSPNRASDPNKAQVIVGIVAWDRMTAEAHARRDRRFWTMRLGNSIKGTGSGGPGAKGRSSNPDEALRQELAGVPPADEALMLVVGAITRKLAALFNLVAAEIDISSGLSSLGVDSLLAVELRNWIGSVIQAKVTVFEILQTATIREFAKLVVERCAFLL